MNTFLAQNGGILGTLLVLVTCFNLLMSAVQSICNQLKLTESPFLQKLGAYGAMASAWLSANVPTQRSAPAVTDQQQMSNH